jgi:hypothetical protein
MERHSDYESIEVPDNYTGPRLSFPLLPDHATSLVEAFRLKQVRLPGSQVPTNSVLCAQENGPGFRVFLP